MAKRKGWLGLITYDAVGNRLSSLGVSPYNVNTSNKLTSTPSTTYMYDSNGNTQSKTDSTGTTNFTWDFENHMSSVTLPGTGGTVTFKYDPFGRRIEKTTSSTTSIYAYDGDNLIEETNASGGVVARYSQGLNIDEPLAMLRSGATSYYHADGLGSVTSLSEGRRAKETAMRRKRLARLLRKLRAMRRNLPLRDQLLMRLGAAKSAAGRAFPFVHLQVPGKDQQVTRETFQFRVDKKKLQEAEWRDGHYLLRSNLTAGDPSVLSPILMPVSTAVTTIMRHGSDSLVSNT